MTTRTLILITAVLCSGCGWYPLPYGTGDFRATSGCIEVRSDFRVSQEALDHDVKAAREVLDKHGIVMAGDFCREFSGVPIAISSGTTVGGHENGEYNLLRGILLTREGTALVHEFIHEVDITRDLSICSAAHCDWRVKGYYIADSDYALEAFDLKTNQQSITFEGE